VLPASRIVFAKTPPTAFGRLPHGGGPWSSLASLSRNPARSFIWHSQTVSTRHPVAVRSATFRPSRAMFRATLASQ
jgi:hypothetical protein